MPASTTSAHGAETVAIRIPPSTGPSSIVMRVAPWKSAFARPTSASSSPSSSGTITFWAAKYGPASAPSRKASTRIAPNASTPAQCSTGIASISGARIASASTIVRQAPRRRSTAPPGMPSSGEADQLRADDRAHPRRGAGRDEHEPRQREPRHLRPGRRDDLGREQRDDRSPAEQRPLGQTSHSPSLLHGLAVELDARAREPEVLDDVPVDPRDVRPAEVGQSRSRARDGRCRRSSRRRACCACSA